MIKNKIIIVVSSKTTKTTTTTVIANNARAYNPTVIDSTDKNVTYLSPNANYTMDGTQSYVNSGWIWPGRLWSVINTEFGPNGVWQDFKVC